MTTLVSTPPAVTVYAVITILFVAPTVLRAVRAQPERETGRV